MAVIAGFQAYPLDFDRSGSLIDPSQLPALQDALRPETTDLLVLSHGWNNDMAEADDLYRKLLACIRALIDDGTHAMLGRQMIVCTVHWPSKRFAEEDLIPGGVASAEGRHAFIIDQLKELREQFNGGDQPRSPPDPDKVLVFDRLIALLPNLETSEAAQNEFGRLFRSIMPSNVNEEEPALPDAFFTINGAELLNRLSRSVIDSRPAMGGAAGLAPAPGPASLGGAASLGNLFSGIENGAQNILNLFTYYEMKNRAGVIGAGGVHSALLQVQRAHATIRLHLVGHSFGGRLISAALAANAGGSIRVSSISLLQAAFSHFGFASNYDGKTNGFFRDALQSGRLTGPMAVTYSANDKAVGIAYPLASRLRQQIGASLGDASDRYGGIGRNGALKTPEANTVEFDMPDSKSKYPSNLRAGKILNVKGDAYISSHSDVKNPSVAHMILSAIEATSQP